MATFAHRAKAKRISRDIDCYLKRGGKIRQIPSGFSGDRSSYGHLGCSADDAARARMNGQKARDRQRKVQ